MKLYKVCLSKVEIEALLLIVADLVINKTIEQDEALAPDSLKITSEVFLYGSDQVEEGESPPPKVDYLVLGKKLEALAQILLISEEIQMGADFRTFDLYIRGPESLISGTLGEDVSNPLLIDAEMKVTEMGDR